jgi:hypothetical protein
MSRLSHILLSWVLLVQMVALVEDNPHQKTDSFHPWQAVASFESHVLCWTEADRRTAEHAKRFKPFAEAPGGTIVSLRYRCVEEGSSHE